MSTFIFLAPFLEKRPRPSPTNFSYSESAAVFMVGVVAPKKLGHFGHDFA